MVTGRATTKRTSVFGLIVLVASVVSGIGPAWASGPYEEFGRQGSIKAEVYVRIPLGPSIARTERKASVDFTVKGEFSPAHPEFQRGRGPYVGSTGVGLSLLDMHFAMFGKGSGLDAVGWTMLGADGNPD
jgi:hypothetical protein